MPSEVYVSSSARLAHVVRRRNSLPKSGILWDHSAVENDDLVQAPPRSKELLETWVQEFAAQNSTRAMSIDVAIQDGAEGRDTGLVVVRLSHGGAEVFMQPVSLDSTEWETTLTARPGELTLSPLMLSSLAAEVAVASSLCAFLQFKSLEWDRMRGMHE